jgi:hypothetical protein
VKDLLQFAAPAYPTAPAELMGAIAQSLLVDVLSRGGDNRRSSCPLPKACGRGTISGHMIFRRALLAGSVTLLAAPVAAEAQQARVYRRPHDSAGVATRQGMRT